MLRRGREACTASSLKRAVCDLDHVAAWLTLTAFVNVDPGHPWTTLVVNSVSELLLELFGPEVCAPARTASCVAALPFNLPVVLAAELEIAECFGAA